MAVEPPAAGGLDGLAKEVRKVRGPPPVHLWNPPYCGDLDIRIAADGTWYYMKTPIGRMPLVKLFSSVLKREDGRHFLVTPVEKIGIVVDDAPFAAVELQTEGEGRDRRLSFRTQVDDWVEVGPGHPLRFEKEAGTDGVKPYVHVRRDLWARVSRTLLHDLANIGEVVGLDGVNWFGVYASATFYPMVRADELEGLM